MEKTTRKTDSLAWELKLAPALRDCEGLLSVSSVTVGGQRYMGLRCAAVADCFGSFTTACLRILSETGLLSFEVTKYCCFFFLITESGQDSAECAKMPRGNKCISSCSSELVSAQGRAARWYSWARSQQFSFLAQVGCCRTGCVTEERKTLSFSALKYSKYPGYFSKMLFWCSVTEGETEPFWPPLQDLVSVALKPRCEDWLVWF